ncbi:MAG TPA: NFACT RNA binding domain-containing protein [Phototrophicaceae bacterium]|nr:NFACT RNA binding domain-containing protein [Phototrophicaceae bacterium]
MYLDVFTLSALVDEFMDTLVGGRVQDSLSVDEHGLGLEIYASHQRRYLYMSADPMTPRIHLVPEKLRRGLQTPTQLGLLFRRYVEGGAVTHVSQPEWERIIHIDVAGPEGDVTIIVEPMERRSNLLLVQNGIILDCMRRVGPDENRYRVSLPNHEYAPPPPQIGKLSPFGLTLESLIGLFEQNQDAKRKTHQVLTSRLLAVSPLVAKEIVYRASGAAEQKADDADYEKLLGALQSVIAPLQKRDWQPGVAEGDRGIAAFSVYPLESMDGWRRVESISEALTLFYTAPVGEDAYNAAKVPIHEAIQEAAGKEGAKLASLQRSMTDESERESLRQSGELILAYQYAIQKGQKELRAQYDLDAPELVIALDTSISPLENAQRYFEKYNKAKRALDDVPRLIRETENELQFLRQLDTDLTLASNWPEIDEVQQALQNKGYWKGKPTGKIAGSGKSAPLRVVSRDGFVIWVGRNSRQNEIVTFDKGGPQDTWLHAHEKAGAHVIVKFDGRQIPEKVIEKAAALAAYYSAGRNEGSVIVDVAARRSVRKIKGAAVGMVTYKSDSTRTVAPSGETDF